LLHRQLTRQGTLALAPVLSSMETQIKKVTRLVEDLLDVSKIQVGRLEYIPLSLTLFGTSKAQRKAPLSVPLAKRQGMCQVSNTPC